MRQPPKHGQLSLSNWKPEHAKRHLSLITKHANEVAPITAVPTRATRRRITARMERDSGARDR
jgi:hypothetical protein